MWATILRIAIVVLAWRVLLTAGTMGGMPAPMAGLTAGLGAGATCIVWAVALMSRRRTEREAPVRVAPTAEEKQRASV